MKRLRHPINSIRESFGTVGLIVAMIALLAALGGTAFAAKGALTGKQKKEVEKIAKKFSGKPGAAGSNGTNGKDGANGTNGAPGEKGDSGANGKSVVLTSEPEGVNCEKGGTKVEVEGNPAGKKYVCNGKNGTTGFTETLPQGKTETGTVSAVFPSAITEGNLVAPISFDIPLEAALGETAVHYVSLAAQSSHSVPQCEGTAESPEAEEANLCVYQGATEGVPGDGSLDVFVISPPGNLGAEQGAGTAGAFVHFHFEATTPSTEAVEVQGSWAVTG